jgi:sugar (pentulose or hexulose) kinase
MNSVILSIDCGTQSLRALLFDSKGNLLDKVQVEYEPYFSTRPGWAEQDPEIYWSSLCKACLELKKKDPNRFAKIAGIGITTQRASMVNIDEQGNPLRPVITWLDQRKASQSYFPNIFLKSVFKLAGVYDSLIRTQEEGKGNWIIQNQPEIWDKTYKYLQMSGFLNARLTGTFSDSIASQIGHIPFDYKKMKWATGWNLTSSLFPIEPAKLPKLVQPGKPLGKITAKASEKTGIPVGIQVIACGSDKGCETIGSGVLDKTMASLSFGTTATVQTTTKDYFESLKYLPAYPAPIPGHYNPEIEIFRGYWMISWFKNEFAHKEIQKAKEKGVIPEVAMNDLLTQAPPGSMGLIVQPYWSPGLKHPEAKGSMIGFGDVHKKAHVYRAVIEGLAYGLLDGLKSMEKAGKFNVERLTVSGGASQSDEICQISADVFNLPIVKGKTFETSGLGAAIVTSVGLGIHSSFETAVQQMVEHQKEYTPNPKNTDLYRNLYTRVYQKMYPALKEMYTEIKDITGYPE